MAPGYQQLNLLLTIPVIITILVGFGIGGTSCGYLKTSESDLPTTRTTNESALATNVQSPSSSNQDSTTLDSQPDIDAITPPILDSAMFLGNLRAAIPEGWGQALVASSQPGGVTNELPDSNGSVYISWAIIRDGLTLVPDQFLVDLYLDNLFIQRWVVDTVNPGIPTTIQNWDQLNQRVRLTNGSHTLKLIIDPTDLITETDEEDNIYTTEFQWSGAHSQGEKYTVARERLPNLTPFTPTGWDSPIRIIGANGITNGFDVNDITSIQVAFKNNGLSSIDKVFLAYLYLDDLPLAKFTERSLIAESAVITPAWNGLSNLLRIKPGAHTLTLVLDPTNLITETDPQDNIVSTQYYWGDLTFPNFIQEPENPQPKPGHLNPLTLPGWKSPLVISNTTGSLISPPALTHRLPIFASWAITNTGDVPYQKPFTIELALDNTVVGVWSRSELEPGGIDFILDWSITNNPGRSPEFPARIKLFLVERNPHGLQSRRLLAQETLNWITSPEVNSKPVHYSDSQITDKLARLESILSFPGMAINNSTDSYLNDTLDIVDVTYYSLYGKSLKDEPLSIHILTEADYSGWLHLECRDRIINLNPQSRSEQEQRCNRLEGFSGFTTFWRGRHHIVVRGERPPIQVLDTLAHELGHFRQSLLNSGLNGSFFPVNILALKESQAYAHQAVFLRRIESLTGRDLLLYPKLEGYRDFVAKRFSDLNDSVAIDEHSRGRLILWMALLTDPNLRRNRNELFDNQILSETATQNLFNYLMKMNVKEGSSYVSAVLKELKTQKSAIVALADSRLLSELPYWNEGSPFLREAGLLLP